MSAATEGLLDPLEEEAIAAEETVTEYTVPLAVKEVLLKARQNDGLARGLRECCKALDRRKAHLCVLAQDCDHPEYVKLIEALCGEHNINLLRVPFNKELGEWAGLCKYDKEGTARSVVGASSVVVTDFGEDSPALQWLLDHFRRENGGE